jgi:hypothetical protein
MCHGPGKNGREKMRRGLLAHPRKRCNRPRFRGATDRETARSLLQGPYSGYSFGSLRQDVRRICPGTFASRQCRQRTFRLLGADDRACVEGKRLGQLQPFANGAWPCYLRITCTTQERRCRENCCGPFARTVAPPIGALHREQRASRPDFSSNGGIGCLFGGVDHGGSI